MVFVLITGCEEYRLKVVEEKRVIKTYPFSEPNPIPILTQDKRLYWCNNNTFQLNKRLFIPYVYKGKAVGYTARWASRDPRADNIPKFYT